VWSRVRRLCCWTFVGVTVLGTGCGGQSRQTTRTNGTSNDGGAWRAGTGGVAGSASASGEGGAAETAGGAAGAGDVGDVPDFDDLIVQSSRMSAYEGLAVIATFDHNFGENSRSSPRVDVVSDGAFELVWKQGFNRDSFGAYLVLFVDRDGDGWCTEGIDPAWSDFVDNDLRASQTLVHDFDPDSLPEFTGPITCAEFDTWFDEDFGGL
jgi:hypothetical protein